MSPLKPDESHVLLCDWQGRLNWTSKAALYEAYGDLAWNYVLEHDREAYRQAFARATTLKQSQKIDVDCKYGGRYRAWLWPLHWPETAVCILAMRIPQEMVLLTPREHECLERLGGGMSVGQVAEELDVSASTVHTLMQRARKKLKLHSIEELISFAARYCFPRVGPLLPASRRRDHKGASVAR